jgi:hypothetical protein
MLPFKEEGESAVERVYIGGLDPPHLTPSHVVERLEKLSGIQIISVDASDEKPFLHINVQSVHPNDTALSIISKTYNNVRWKGCKLMVQAAQPHFLERIGQEREARRQAIQQESAQQSRKDSHEDKENCTTSTLPRRLVIRQGHGIRAHPVDTKPCETTDWESFSKIWNQLRKRRDRRTETNKDCKTTAFYGRAVHLRFDYQIETEQGLLERDYGAINDEEKEDDDNEIADDTKYEWSSEEDEDFGESGQACQIFDKRGLRPDSDHAASDEMTNEKPPTKYEWSSDEDESDDGNDMKSNIAKPRPTTTLSEFEAAIDFDEQNDDGPYDEGYANNDHFNMDFDLEQDVKHNMGILGELYPEFRDSKPKEIPHDGSVEEASSGWNTQNRMQRYDPTLESAQHFEIHHQQTDSPPKEQEGEEEPVGSNGTGESKQSDDKVSDSRQSIYNEIKLEEVFRQARNAGEGGGFQVSALFGEQPEELKRKEEMKSSSQVVSSFSFNFDLGPVRTEGQETKTSNFSFDCPLDSLEGRESMNEAVAPKVVEIISKGMPPAATKKRWKGLIFPESVVNQHYEKFFQLNNGEKIQQDSEHFRTDEAVRTEWQKDRQLLTVDWKRKRKYAQSRLHPTKRTK